MANCITKYFGEITYESDAVWRFAAGLPGFESEREFLPIEQPATHPLVYLQSLSTPAVCFIGMPAHLLEPGYQPEMSEEDRDLIGLDGPLNGGILCLALITVREDGSTANLMAPIVANLDTGQAVQAISPSGSYSHRHPIGN